MFLDVLRCSKMFSDVLICYQMFLDVLFTFSDVLRCSLHVLRYSQMFPDVLKMFSDMSKMFSGCSQNVVGLMVDCLSRLDAEIVNKWIPSVGWITELMDSLSSSDDRIGGCPQQVGCHLVLIWSIFDPLT